LTKAVFVIALLALGAGISLAVGGADSVAPIAVAFVVALVAAGIGLVAGSASSVWRIANAGAALMAILGLAAMVLASRSR
jgi:hypothetical protein